MSAKGISENDLAIKYLHQKMSDIITNNQILNKILFIFISRILHKRMINEVISKMNYNILSSVFQSQVEKLQKLEKVERNFTKKKRNRSQIKI
jgi:hypothetical protein